MFQFLAFALAAGVPEEQTQAWQDGRPVIAKVFRGRWARTLPECRFDDPGAIDVTDKAINAYEADFELIQATPVNLGTGKSGGDRYEQILLTGGRAEMKVFINPMRIGFEGGKLYVVRGDSDEKDELFLVKNSNVRCPPGSAEPPK
jgi:hypothetical protein